MKILSYYPLDVKEKTLKLGKESGNERQVKRESDLKPEQPDWR